VRSCAPPWGLPRRAMACTTVPRVLSSRPAIAGWIGRRTRCIREKEAHSASFLALCAEARIPKGSGPFSFLTSTGLRIGTGQRSMDRTTARGGRSLTSCRKAASVLADGMPCTFRGCSSVGRARPRHGRGHDFETRHPLHFGCVHALRGHATWCWWPGMCAVLGQITCSETPHPTGCSRLGTAEVDLLCARSSAGRAAAL
jgi:hypothetical protein